MAFVIIALAFCFGLAQAQLSLPGSTCVPNGDKTVVKEICDKACGCGCGWAYGPGQPSVEYGVCYQLCVNVFVGDKLLCDIINAAASGINYSFQLCPEIDTQVIQQNCEDGCKCCNTTITSNCVDSCKQNFANILMDKICQPLGPIQPALEGPTGIHVGDLGLGPGKK